MGCGRVAGKRDLLRLAISDGTVVADRAARLPGRGAYVCDAACATTAVERRALSRALRRPVSTTPEFIESLI